MNIVGLAMPPFESNMGRWCLISGYEHGFTKRNVPESWHSAHASDEPWEHSIFEVDLCIT
jgi:hypothetical protein